MAIISLITKSPNDKKKKTNKQTSRAQSQIQMIQLFFNQIQMHLPSINKDKVLLDSIHPIDQIRTEPKTRKLVQFRQWGPQSCLINISNPEAIVSPLIKKKFKINIKYKLNPNDKTKAKTLYFGDDDDYVISKDKQKRFHRLLHLKNIDNPLHPNYWKAILLNKYQTMGEALSEFNRYFISQAEKGLANMPAKKIFVKPQHLTNRKTYYVPGLQ